MGAKDFDFADQIPSYKDGKPIMYRSTSSERNAKPRRQPRSKSAKPSGMHQRRNKRVHW